MIESLRLKNFRRYQDQTFHFTPGVNYLRGENNAGKTTLFYAIEYALFGAVSGFRTLSMLMQSKARDMGVELVFKGRDGERYRLQRVHKKPPRAKTQINGHFTLKHIQGEDEERYLLSSDFQDREEALALRLSEIFGVGRRLFELALHLRQGEISATLAGTPKLDMLLGITAAVQANGELRAAALELEKAAEGRDALEQSLAHAERERARGVERLAELDAEASGLDTSGADLNAQLARLADASEALSRVLDRLKGYREQYRASEERRRGAEQARASLETFTREHGDRTTLAASISRLTETRETELTTQRDSLEQIRNALRELDRTQGDIQGRIARRRALPDGEDATCETCGQPIDHARTASEIADWERELAGIETELSRLQDARTQTESAIADLQEQEQERRLQHQAMSSRLEEFERLAQASEQAAAALDEADVLATAWSEVIAAMQPLRQQLADIADLSAAPLSSDEPAADQAETLEQQLRDLDAQLGRRHGGLSAELAAKDDLKRRLAADTQDAKTRIDEAERETARIGEEVARLQDKTEQARRLRQCAKAFQELQVRLREQTASTLGEQTLALYRQLSDTQDIKDLRVDPETYAVLVRSKDLSEETPAYVSQGGGHRQLLGLAYRLALARMVGNPPFLLLDEPSDGLDAHHRDLLIERLQGVEASEQLLVVTHQDTLSRGQFIDIERQGNVSRLGAAS